MRDDVEINFDDYPFNIPAIRNLKTLDFHPDVTFLIGENGSGKSTLLEALAICLGFGAEGGTRNVRFRTADTISNLHMYLKATRGPLAPKDYYFLRAESFYNVATYMDGIGYLDSYGGASRQRFQNEGGGLLAFKNCNDLRNIKGIGPKTAENMCEWLRFE